MRNRRYCLSRSRRCYAHLTMGEHMEMDERNNTMVGECRNGMMWTGTHWLPVETGSLATAFFVKGFVMIFFSNAIAGAIIVFYPESGTNLLLLLFGVGGALGTFFYGLTQFAAGSRMVSRIMRGTNVNRFLHK